MRGPTFLGVVLAMGMVVTSQGTERGIEFEAGAGVVAAPFIITNGCLCQLAGSGFTNGGRAVYSFTITNAGEYAVVAQVNAPTGASNAFCVNIDGEPQEPGMIWDVPATSGFVEKAVMWRMSVSTGLPKASAKYFQLTTGTHQLIIRGTGTGTQVKSFRLVQRPAPPGNLRIGGSGK